MYLFYIFFATATFFRAAIQETSRKQLYPETKVFFKPQPSSTQWDHTKKLNVRTQKMHA